MSRSTLFGTIAVAAAVAVLPLATSGVSAQPRDSYDDGYDNGYDDSIVVTGPHARQVGRSSLGAPVMEMTAQSIVYTDDLDLRTRAGRYMLRQRVSAAADEACDQLDEAFPSNGTDVPSPSECRGDAIRRAQDQVDYAIYMRGE